MLKRRAFGYRNMEYFRLKSMQVSGYRNSRYVLRYRHSWEISYLPKSERAFEVSKLQTPGCPFSVHRDQNP